MARRKSIPNPTRESRVTKGRKPTHIEADAGAAGQSGDLQGLPGRDDAENESVRELVEEGQFFEASLVDAVENAPDPEAGPLRPHKRREDDVPPEYTDQPADEPKE